MKTRAFFIAAALPLAVLATGCKDIPGGQIRILGDTTHTTFDGNAKVLDGKYGDAEGGITIEEGFAGAIEINIGEPDEKTGIVEGADFPEVIPTGVSITVIADSDGKRYLVTVARDTSGALPASGSLEVSDSSYEGSISIPIRIKPQEGAGPRQEPLPWPYGGSTSTSSSSSGSTSSSSTTSSSGDSSSSSSGSGSGGGGGGS
jgi:uncharacterized membrane protein YgcG